MSLMPLCLSGSEGCSMKIEMSFNDPGFLFSNRPTERERDAEKAAWERQRESVRSCYKWATRLVVLTMLFVALPTGLERWHWQVVIGAACVITILGAVMLWKRALSNGLICLVFAWGILPGWIYAAPTVIKVVREQYQVIAKEWERVL